MKNNNMIVLFILCLWFVISFVTNILGPLMPLIIEGFEINNTMAGFLPFSFFLAYFLVSIPAGAMTESIGPKKAMLLAFSVNLIGTAIFSIFPVYGAALIALFFIGMGMAMLQVIINPLMRTAGGEAHFAFFSVMGQLVFGLASFVSPFVFSALMAEIAKGDASAIAQTVASLTPENLGWVSFYWLFAVIFIVVLAIISQMNIPRLQVASDELSSPADVYIQLLKKPQVILFALGIAAYVGTEQALANWMSQYLSTHHGVDPTKEGAQAVGLFWGLMSLGCILGLGLLKLLDSKVVLRLFTLVAMCCLAAAVFGSKEIALMAFPATGFFISVMFSVIFSLALNSSKDHHGAFSGILCSGIFGGALLPLIVGIAGDLYGLKVALVLLYIPLGFILSISFWAKPLINNETISLSKLFGKEANT
ncbi:MFS transporter [Teredinibacter sp. KSP-S5-2]|uniref:MFS transporter n=1 Tax=Teredinibacter sp. KSP-S5-2 TaxID=3034506 RepID=UPI002934B96C|nr:MFS transporter [Teredinibacter sp. KSP-S5-2]WNO08762.1 MFS transporter [Teredinibacter sp. KSP-S5-2]